MIILSASKTRLKKTFQGYRSYPTKGATSVPPTLTGHKKFLTWSSALLKVPNESLVNKLKGVKKITSALTRYIPKPVNDNETYII